MKRSVVATVLVMGCSGETVRGQPIIAEPATVLEPETSHERMPHSGVRGAVLISPATPADGRYVGLQPPDLSTATGRTIPSLVFGPEAADLAALVLSEPTRVTLRTFPEDRPVEVELLEGSTGYGNVTTTVVVQPRETLEDQWYGLSVDVPAPVFGGSGRDGRVIARFRPDSHPVFQGMTAGTVDGERVLEAHFSELVRASLPPTEWRIWDDAGPLGCQASGPDPSAYPSDTATFRCRRSEVGTVHVDFGGVLTTSLGDAVVTAEEQVVTRVAMAAPPSAEGFSTTFD